MKYGCFMFVLSLAVLLVAAVGFFSASRNQSIKILTSQDIKQVQIAGQNIKVELAVTKEAQGKGLSGRESLSQDEGMLFVFGVPGKYAFWMKEMNFPLDMIWIGEDSRVVYIKENADPASYPESYVSDVDAKYVLEVNAGFSAKNGLKVGDNISFSY